MAPTPEKIPSLEVRPGNGAGPGRGGAEHAEQSGERNLRQVIFRVVSLYVVFGVLWILVSDRVLEILVQDVALHARISMVKGWVYVGFTALLLYVLLKDETRIWRKEREARSAAELLLRASEARFQSIYHSVNDALFIHDLHTGRILDVNRRMCEMYGCTVEQARRSFVNDLSLGESPYSELEAMALLRKAAAGDPQIFTWHCRRFDRGLFWGEIRMRRALVGEEDVIIVSVSDITARKATEDALTESNTRFRQLAETIEEVFWIQSEVDGSVVYVSPAYEKVWGRPCKDLLENPASWAEAIAPDDRDRVLKAIKESKTTGQYAETYRIIRPDGRDRWILDRAFPLKDEAGRVSRTVGIATDITERRNLETQFNHAQKMEAIGTLAGGIAHDFNNILGAIMGYAELAKIDTHDPALHGNLEEILAACKRASDLVRQILAFSRQQEQNRAPLQMGRVVGEACKLLRALLPSSLLLDLKLSKDAPTVLADATQIHQVVMNLCTNAAQATEGRPQSRISVSLGRVDVDEEFVRLHAGTRPGVYACLTVADNGPGMDQLTLLRIFEPFFTTKAPGKGTGLGLAVVHGIVQRHEGVVTVESGLGQGTTFRIYLPEYQSAEIPGAPAGPVSAPSGGQGQRILVVDDEEPLVRMVGRILTKLGYQTVVMHEAEAAWAAFEAAPQSFDMIISDLTMPGLTGMELAAKVRAINTSVPIVIMTGFYANLTEPQLKAAGIDEILMKPVEITSLSVVIDQVLKNRIIS